MQGIVMGMCAFWHRYVHTDRHIHMDNAHTLTMQFKSFARVGLMGNPSDGFFGKTIAVTIR